MATRVPIVLSAGEQQQLQSGDPLSPAAVSALGIVDVNCTLPANTSCIFLDSLTVSTGIAFTIPSTSSTLVFNGRYSYWDSIVTLPKTFVSQGTSAFADITGLIFASVANAVYEIEAVLRIQSSDVNGINFQVNNSGGTSTGQMFAVAAGGMSTRNDGVCNFASAAFATFTQNFCTAIATDQRFTLTGIFMPGANPGNFTIQVKKVTAGTATIYAGSVMKIKRLS